MGTKFHKDDIVQKARNLRKKGISAAEIARRLRVGDTTVLRWCSDISSINPYHLNAKRLRDKAKQRGIESVGGFAITKKSAKILTSLFYWCEGAKYPSNNFIAFTNSDVSLVKTFLGLFRLGFQPEEGKLRASLQLHTIHDKKKEISFWSDILKIPETQFYKPTITKPTKNMKRRGYRGTCTIRYYDIYLLLEISGIFNEFANKFGR